MSMKFIFLDVDGVLNCHEAFPNGYCGIRPISIARLNRIINATGAKIVLSSAWRYMLFDTDAARAPMTLLGFQYMLMIHGAVKDIEIVGHTVKDGDELGRNRGAQIQAYLNLLNEQPEAYVVIDDLDLGISEAGHPFVHTHGKIGLTDDDVEEAIRLLDGDINMENQAIKIYDFERM